MNNTILISFALLSLVAMSVSLPVAGGKEDETLESGGLISNLKLDKEEQRSMIPLESGAADEDQDDSGGNAREKRQWGMYVHEQKKMLFLTDRKYNNVIIQS